jgi:hypothetical protein
MLSPKKSGVEPKQNLLGQPTESKYKDNLKVAFDPTFDPTNFLTLQTKKDG